MMRLMKIPPHRFWSVVTMIIGLIIFSYAIAGIFIIGWKSHAGPCRDFRTQRMDCASTRHGLVSRQKDGHWQFWCECVGDR